MDKVDGLVIVAAGNSTRFGGFPKAFCSIGNELNIERTIRLFKPYVSKIFVIVNRQTLDEYYGKINDCRMVSIVTGQGDAHSLLRGLRKIKMESSLCNVMVCWGDAVFRSEQPVVDIMQAAEGLNEDSVGISICSIDEVPYAWYDVEHKYIVKSNFADLQGKKEKGIHDQSLFYFRFKEMIVALEKYRMKLGIEENTLLSNIEEMKLLYAFEYFYKNGHPMEYALTDSGSVMSFNTQEELSTILRKIKS